MRPLIALTLISLAAAPLYAETAPPSKKVQRTLAAIGAVQELPPFSAAELEARKAAVDGDAEIAADAELNAWKLCVLDSVTHWAKLRAGAGTVAEGAFGRCAEGELRYRDQLMKLSQDGRQVIDLQMARAMTKSLEDTWRPRLVAAALEHDLAVQGGAAATAAPGN